MKTLQIRLYSVFLKVPIKHVQEKENGKETWVKKKKNILLSQRLFNCNIEKQIKWFFVSTLFLELISILVNSMFFLISFICEYTSRSWTDKSETLWKFKQAPKSMMDRGRSRTTATSKTEHFVITVDIDILIPPRDGDRKIMKSIRI